MIKTWSGTRTCGIRFLRAKGWAIAAVVANKSPCPTTTPLVDCLASAPAIQSLAHDDDASKGRGRLGLVVPDVANQVTDYTSKQRTKEEDAKDREQP